MQLVLKLLMVFLLEFVTALVLNLVALVQELIVTLGKKCEHLQMFCISEVDRSTYKKMMFVVSISA